MTRLFIRLKWRLWRNGLRDAPAGRIAGMVLGAVFGAVLTAVFFSLAVTVRSRADDDTTVTAGLVCSLLVFAWWLAPLITGGVDETVDPSRLRLLPLTDAQLRRGQIVAGLIGPAPLFATAGAIAIGVAFTHSLAGLPVVVVALALNLLVALVGSRAVATGLGSMRRTRRGRELSVLVMIVCVMLLAVTYQVAAQSAANGSNPARSSVARWLSWTPPGTTGRAVWQAGHGHILAAIPLLLPASAVLLFAGWLWSRALNTLLLSADSTESGTLSAGGASGELFTGIRRSLPRSPAGAAMAREALYLKRSPGRRNALLMAIVFTVGYSVIIGRAQLSKPTSMFAPLSMVIFAGSNAFNQFGWSPGEFWLEAVSGVSPRVRTLPRRLFSLFIVFVAPMIAVLLFFAFSRAVGALLIATIVLAFAALSLAGVGGWFSMRTAIPVADNGNPWANRKGNGGVSLMVFVSSLVGYLPTMAIGAIAGFGMWHTRSRPLWFALIAAGLLAIGGGVFHVGGRFAAGRLTRNDAEIIHQLETRTVR
ncbi:MAG: hypothetical protein WCC60_10120 [Ilumatobacteraceae bacterium]